MSRPARILDRGDVSAGIVAQRLGAALAAAKRKGVMLGNPRLQEAGAAGVASIKRGADDFARQMLPVIRDIQKSGIQTLRAIAEQLTARRVPTRRGGSWDAPQVRSLLLRSDQRTVAAGERAETGGRRSPSFYTR
jgi:hypothetical protein